MHSADGLGDDLREDQHQQREHNTHCRYPVLAPERSCLRTNTRSTKRVGKGIERQDRCERLIQIVLHPHQTLARGMTLINKHRDMRARNTQQHRLEQ